MSDQRREAEALQAQIDMEFRDLLRTRGGRYFFWKLFGATDFFVPMQSMTGETACYYEGKRDIGAQVFEYMFTYAPEAFMLMREEGMQRDAMLSILNTKEDEDDGE